MQLDLSRTPAWSDTFDFLEQKYESNNKQPDDSEDEKNSGAFVNYKKVKYGVQCDSKHNTHAGSQLPVLAIFVETHGHKGAHSGRGCRMQESGAQKSHVTAYNTLGNEPVAHQVCQKERIFKS